MQAAQAAEPASKHDSAQFVKTHAARAPPQPAQPSLTPVSSSTQALLQAASAPQPRSRMQIGPRTVTSAVAAARRSASFVHWPGTETTPEQSESAQSARPSPSLSAASKQSSVAPAQPESSKAIVRSYGLQASCVYMVTCTQIVPSSVAVQVSVSLSALEIP